LNLTRSIGDFGYKADKSRPYDEQLIICKPDITITPRSNQYEFILMGCDGIFDAFGTNNQAVVDMVNGFLKETKNLEKTVHSMLDKLLAA
jgi:serine/threonine protein phosphatase PrpC